MDNFFHILKEEHHFDIRVDAVSKKVYSNDASIYEVEPIAVFLPRSVEELQLGIKIAHDHKVPIIPRGAATGIAGGCIGHGLVIDTSKYLNKILSIDVENKQLSCEPGVIQDQVNHAVSKYNLRLGPDTSTGNRATIGGMVSCNSCGAHALKYGYMGDHIKEIDLILSDGEMIHLKELSEQELHEKCSLNSREGHIYREALRIQREYGDDIKNHFPKTPRRSSGYSLDKLKFPLNLSQVIAGSEGTLGFISKVTVHLSPSPLNTGMVIISVKDLIEGLKLCLHFKEYKPYALELIDKKIMLMGAKSPSMQGKLGWLQRQDDALFIVEFEGDSKEEVQERCRNFQEKFRNEHVISWTKVILDKKTQEDVWNLRKSGLGLLLSSRTYLRAIAFIEDISIPPQYVPSFCEKLLPYLKSQGKEVGIYGHVGDGGLHIRPFIDLRLPQELKLMQKIMHDVMIYVKEVSGVLSGEHGDGLIRSWTNSQMFGERLYQAFTELKDAFDKENLMNPGKIVNGPEVLQNLKLSPATPHEKFTTFLNFGKEGGIELAADLCNGNGQCRKKEGVMCPSFQATNDEKDSTRARANALRAFFHKKISFEELLSKDFYSVMELCIQCKGCKTECPSEVDMAKMKSEYLYHYYQNHRTPIRDYLFGYLSALYKQASHFPSFVNWIQRQVPFKAILGIFGITSKRNLPSLAKKRFSEHLKERRIKVFKKKVVLFNDTFTEFLNPKLGISTCDLLEKMGFEVIVPPFNCCGRTLISKGMLPEAKEYAKILVDILYPYAKNGISIVGLEPSCILTIKDEFQDFYLEKEKVEIVSHKAKTIDQFLEENLEELKPILKTFSHPIYIHTHCHQKADVGSHPTLKVLEAMPHHPRIKEINSGCCGMAGSFGYESEHYLISKKIGELSLFPKLRNKEDDAVIIANGVSCRTQIHDGCSIKSVHLVEFLSSLIRNS